MSLTPKAQEIFDQINRPDTKLGDLRKMAKAIKRDHALAQELWSTGSFFPRQLAILIMDKKQLDQERIDELCRDIQAHDYDQQNQLTDWLMANQLVKDKKILALMGSWDQSPSPLQRRIYWYHQGRLRWTGQTPPDNTEALLDAIEQNMAAEVPEVQWAMNFTAGWIGIYDTAHRARCIALGERIGLYKDEIVPRGCTPNYLPEFIRIQSAKIEK